MAKSGRRRKKIDYLKEIAPAQVAFRKLRGIGQKNTEKILFDDSTIHVKVTFSHWLSQVKSFFLWKMVSQFDEYEIFSHAAFNLDFPIIPVRWMHPFGGAVLPLSTPQHRRTLLLILDSVHYATRTVLAN